MAGNKEMETWRKGSHKAKKESSKGSPEVWGNYHNHDKNKVMLLRSLGKVLVATVGDLSAFQELPLLAIAVKAGVRVWELGIQASSTSDLSSPVD